jgi:hypothetical protein
LFLKQVGAASSRNLVIYRFAKSQQEQAFVCRNHIDIANDYPAVDKEA